MAVKFTENEDGSVNIDIKGIADDNIAVSMFVQKILISTVESSLNKKISYISFNHEMYKVCDIAFHCLIEKLGKAYRYLETESFRIAEIKRTFSFSFSPDKKSVNLYFSDIYKKDLDLQLQEILREVLISDKIQ